MKLPWNITGFNGSRTLRNIKYVLAEDCVDSHHTAEEKLWYNLASRVLDRISPERLGHILKNIEKVCILKEKKRSGTRRISGIIPAKTLVANQYLSLEAFTPPRLDLLPKYTYSMQFQRIGNTLYLGDGQGKMTHSLLPVRQIRCAVRPSLSKPPSSGRRDRNVQKIAVIASWDCQELNQITRGTLEVEIKEVDMVDNNGGQGGQPKADSDIRVSN